jgi:uracil-DNA glycosylase family 4
MNLINLENEIKQCTICENILTIYNINPKPIFSGFKKADILLIGQAPGITEYKVGKPFQGLAGESIKKLFKECGLSNFDDLVYQTSITKCFPGRINQQSVDRAPSKEEIKNCLPFLINQIKFINPKLIVCLGNIAWQNILKLEEINNPSYCNTLFNKSFPKLSGKDIIGSTFKYNDITVLAMIHPSGAANGARAKNRKGHENSLILLKQEIKKLYNKSEETNKLPTSFQALFSYR